MMELKFLNSPEAFEEVFWSTFPSKNPNFFEDYIKLILKKNNKSRYLSKNNQNISRLDFLANNFLFIILVTFRDPLQHAQSLLNQHIKFSKKTMMLSYQCICHLWHKNLAQTHTSMFK